MFMKKKGEQKIKENKNSNRYIHLSILFILNIGKDINTIISEFNLIKEESLIGYIMRKNL